MSDTVQETQLYQKLCNLAEVTPHEEKINLNAYTDHANLANTSLAERITAGLQVFTELVAGDASTLDQFDKTVIDQYIAKLDDTIGSVLDEVLHNEAFQELESLWRGLKYLVDKTDFRANTKIELLDVDKERLKVDFEDATELNQSGLYKHVYDREYDTPGGEPFGAIISDYVFNSSAEDLTLLKNISKVASAAHCPFITGAAPQFFQKDSFDEVIKIEDLTNYMERAEFIPWNSFRQTEDARYIGLTLPKFLLRLPYGQQNPVRQFIYEEQVQGENANKYLWGNSSFAFAANLAQSFKAHGWCVNIRGPESGGKVAGLPLHQYDVGRGLQNKIPSEAIIPETRELELSKLGFIPLSYYKDSDFACFFSANSTQMPTEYDDKYATANSRINARLPYIFLSSRLAHYIKVLQRENIGTNKNRAELEGELNNWIKTLITKMNNPGPELAATHPLSDGKVEVHPIEDNPGFYRVTLHATPHFQIEGMDVNLSLVAQLPTGEK